MEALQRSEALLTAILESTAIGIGVVNEEDRFVYSNTALQGIVGYSRAELRGTTFTDLTDPEDAAGEAARFAELMAGERDH